MYNVFLDHPVTGQGLAVISAERPYDASAIANYGLDQGFRTYTDLWDAAVPDAMLSPAVREFHDLSWMDSPDFGKVRHTCGSGIDLGCPMPECGGDADN